MRRALSPGEIMEFRDPRRDPAIWAVAHNALSAPRPRQGGGALEQRSDHRATPTWQVSFEGSHYSSAAWAACGGIELPESEAAPAVGCSV